MRFFSTLPPLYLSLLFFLSYNSPALSCQTGTQSECESAPFVPGHSLVGAGFDLVSARQTGAFVVDVNKYLTPNAPCTLCPNPLQDNSLQKLPVSLVDWHAFSQCNTEVDSSVHTSVSSLMKVGLNLDDLESNDMIVGGTGSKVYKFATQSASEDRYTFSVHDITCKHYSYRVANEPLLTEEFTKAVNNLPEHYSLTEKDQYDTLIQTYGTHYIHQVHIGGRLRRVTAVRTCLALLNGLSSQEVHSCLSQGFSVGLGRIKLSSGRPSCNKVLENRDETTNYNAGLHKHHTEVVGGTGWSDDFSLTRNNSLGLVRWMNSLKAHPDVVSYSLLPLYKLMPTETQKAGLKAATVLYLLSNTKKSSHTKKLCWLLHNLALNCCPIQTRKGMLTVSNIKAWNLWGDDWSTTDRIVVSKGIKLLNLAARTLCKRVLVAFGIHQFLGRDVVDWWPETHLSPAYLCYAIMKIDKVYQRTSMIQSDNPRWNTDYELGTVNTNSELIVEVWDEDISHDDRLVWCTERLVMGTHTFTCHNGRSGFEVEYTLICDPHLTGDKCERYKPKP